MADSHGHRRARQRHRRLGRRRLEQASRPSGLCHHSDQKPGEGRIADTDTLADGCPLCSDVLDADGEDGNYQTLEQEKRTERVGFCASRCSRPDRSECEAGHDQKVVRARSPAACRRYLNDPAPGKRLCGPALKRDVGTAPNWLHGLLTQPVGAPANQI